MSDPVTSYRCTRCGRNLSPEQPHCYSCEEWYESHDTTPAPSTYPYPMLPQDSDAALPDGLYRVIGGVLYRLR